MKHRKYIYTTLLSLSAFVAGCGTQTVVQKGNEEQIGTDESIFIIGISPEYRAQFNPGTQEVDGWAVDNWSFVAVNTTPTDGYIVAKVKATKGNSRYGLTSVITPKFGPFGPAFQTCTGRKIPTFEAPAGKTTYLGDIYFDISSSKIELKYSNNYENAKNALQKSYPNIISKLQPSELTYLTVTNVNCSPKNITIPIFIK